MRKATVLLSILMTILCAYLYRMTLRFPESYDPHTIGPGGLPQILLIVWAGLSLILLVVTWRRKVEVPLFHGRISLVVAAAIGSFAYLIVMPYLGYFLSTLLFALGLMLGLDRKRWVYILMVSFGWIIFAYLAFYKLLGVPLPLGFFPLG